jgi:hypothetical protein
MMFDALARPHSAFEECPRQPASSLGYPCAILGLSLGVGLSTGTSGSRCPRPRGCEIRFGRGLNEPVAVLPSPAELDQLWAGVPSNAVELRRLAKDVKGAKSEPSYHKRHLIFTFIPTSRSIWTLQWRDRLCPVRFGQGRHGGRPSVWLKTTGDWYYFRRRLRFPREIVRS